MAQINQKRENEFFRLFGCLEEEFIRELEDNATKGYYLNDSWYKAVESLIHLRDRMYLGKDNAVNLGNNIEKCILWDMNYPILKKLLLKPDDVKASIDYLFRGIECNIDVQSGLQQEQYIYSLLRPFSKWSNDRIGLLLATISQINTDRNSFNESYYRARLISGRCYCNGPKVGGAVFSLSTVDDGIVYKITDYEKEIIEKEIEECSGAFKDMYFNLVLFRLICDEVGQRLFALLIKRGINLLQYQNQCGVHLIDKPSLIAEKYVGGSPELLLNYMEEVPSQIDNARHGTASTTAQNAADIWSILPEKLQTGHAKKIFERAKDAGFMTITSNGAKWNDEKQLLAYFASKMSDMFNLQKRVSDTTGKRQISWKPFEVFFGVKGLRTARANCIKYNDKFHPSNAEEIDKLFE